jgi:hypothetical protein
MNRIRGFFGNLARDNDPQDTSDIKAEMGDYGIEDLNDLPYPITKAEVLESLRANGSSALLIGAVEKVPFDTFNDLNDLKRKLQV